LKNKVVFPKESREEQEQMKVDVDDDKEKGYKE
jgi:hypothetical protein